MKESERKSKKWREHKGERGVKEKGKRDERRRKGKERGIRRKCDREKKTDFLHVVLKKSWRMRRRRRRESTKKEKKGNERGRNGKEGNFLIKMMDSEISFFPTSL